MLASCSPSCEGLSKVLGSGDPNARIALVGEAAGAEEDKMGMPFVGPAGKRLDMQLEAVGIKREDVYITNVLKCRPPNNRIDLVPDALARCPEMYLMPELAALPNLRVVVALGATSGGLWFKGGYKATEMTRLARNVGGYVVVGAPHPAYALRKGAFPNDVDTIAIGNFGRAVTYEAYYG